MINNKPLASVLFFFSLCIVSKIASAEGNFYFRGAVIESGCWHESSLPMILCQKKNKIERHILIENLSTSITSPNATIEHMYLDEDKQLTLLRIIYD